MIRYIKLADLDPAPWFTANDEENVAGLVESIRANGLHNPIIVRPRGDRYEIGAGHDRAEAFRRLGETEVYAHVRDSYTDEEWHSLFWRDNNERKDNSDLKRQACREAYALHPEWSTRQVAAFAGCSHTLAHQVRSELEDAGELSAVDSSTVVGRDGKKRPAKKPTAPKLPDRPAGPRDTCDHGVALEDACGDCEPDDYGADEDGKGAVAGPDVDRTEMQDEPDLPSVPSRARVPRRRPYTPKLKAFIAAAVEAASATEDEIQAIPANDFMLAHLRTARDLLDRVIETHTAQRETA